MPQAAGHNSVQAKRPVKGRFAPSPTGRMHAGNIYAALVAWLVAKAQGGSMVLRIEDLDRQRSRSEYADLVQRDFERLGLFWDEGPYYQSCRNDAYRSAYEQLEGSGLVYPCFCSRADLKAASAPHAGEGSVYAGTCRGLSAPQRATRLQEVLNEGRPGPAFRFNTGRAEAEAQCERGFSFTDLIQGPQRQVPSATSGDFVLKRADGMFAYQLAVVVDDAEQGVTSVTRGVDLLSSCGSQMLLQRVLGFSHPEYCHVPLLVAPDGRRLAKRNKDAGMEQLLCEYSTPKGVLGHVAYVAGLQEEDAPASPNDLLPSFKELVLRGELSQTYGQIESIDWR